LSPATSQFDIDMNGDVGWMSGSYTNYDSGYASSLPSNGLYPMTAAEQLARPLFSPSPEPAPPVISAKKVPRITAVKKPQNTVKVHHNAANAHYNTGYDSGYGSSPPSNGLYPMTAAAQLARPLFSPGPPQTAPPVTSAKKAAHTTAGKASRNAGKAHHNTAKARHNTAAKAPQNTFKAHQNIVKAPRNTVKAPRVQAADGATRKQPSPLTNSGTASGEHADANTHTNKPAKHISAVSKAERRKTQPAAKPSQQVQSARAPKAPTTPTKRATINPTTPPNNGKRSATSELEQEAAKKFKTLSPTARPIAERKGLIELMWSPTKGQYKPIAILSAYQKNALQPPFGNMTASNTQIPNTKPATRKIKQPKKPKQPAKQKIETTSPDLVERIPLPIAGLPQPPLPAFARRQIREEDILIPSIEVEEDYISQKLRKALREEFDRSNGTADPTVASAEVNHAFTSDVQTAQAFVQLPTNSQPQPTYQPTHHQSTFDSAYQQVNTGNCFVAYNMSNTNSAVMPDQLVPHPTDAIADAEQATQPNLSMKSEQQDVECAFDAGVDAAVDTAVDAADAPVLDTAPVNAPVDLAPAIKMASAADMSTNYHMPPDLDTSFDLDISTDDDMNNMAPELHPASALARLIADPPEHGLSRKVEPYNIIFTPNERSLEVIMKEPFDSLNETERARILVPLLYGIDPREFWIRASWNPAATPRGDLVGPALACKLKSLADKAAMNPGRKQKQDAVMDMVQIARHSEQKDRQAHIEAMNARRQQAMHSQAAAMRDHAATIQAAATRMHADAARLFLQAEMLEAGQIAPFQNPTQPGDVGQNAGQFNNTDLQPIGPTGQFATASQPSETPEQMGARRQREATMKAHRENARRVQTQQIQQEQLNRK
jgi:hypothetical protein